MGHIELAAPVSHIWYFKGIPSRMGLMLDMSPRSLEKVLYFAAYIVIDPGETPLTKKQLLSEREYREYREKYGNDFKAGMGAEAIKELLQEIDLNEQSTELRKELKEATGQKKVRTTRRLEVVEAFRKSNNRPEWMILEVIPVIPPDLRPMVQLDGGRFATSDLNDLYRRVINRNNRLKRLLDLGAPDIIVRNEKRMLQEAVDALIDNGRRGRPVTGPGNRPLKSLSDMLKGKQGRFRQNLLGKRVDYSGRSVIVIGPELKIYQCGLPKEMALELFKPFVMKKLVNEGYAHNIKSAKRMVERVKPEVWDVLEDVIKEHPVLLNRAPTLHRLGIQAFEPVLVEGRAIKIHPLVCTAYNADFDGDQMAVHVPLSVEAQAEARILMLSAHNLLKPQDGKPVVTPTQDMVLGIYYLTIEKEGEKGEGKIFSDFNEVIMAYQTGVVGLQSKIKVRISKEINGRNISKLVETTPGRVIFNEVIPQDLGFVDRNDEDKMLDLELNSLVDKGLLGEIVARCYRKHGTTKTAYILDKIKELGFKYSTKAGITISITDIEIPPEKEEILSRSDEKVDEIELQFRRGLISTDERYEKIINIWTHATDDITETLMTTLSKFNPIYMMAVSGARGGKQQIRQLAGMRGLMANPSGRIIELPIRACFREGLTVLEYFISTHGARKGLADTALRTADSGYLTRRLVDVSQDVIVREDDCGTAEGILVKEIREGNEVIESLEDRIIGRIAVDDIVNPKTGEIIVKSQELIDEDKAKDIIRTGIKEVKIRSVLTCNTRYGVCAKCYGRDLATGKTVDIGEAIGIIAAQSIGEPGTQLTMRTFHTGGVAGDDITQGLPRVEELFEARKPKGLAIITEIPGTVKIVETKRKREVEVTNEYEKKTYQIPYGARLKVSSGDIVEAGDELTEGSVNPHDILKIKGIRAVQTYLLQEVQKVYRLQGVDINDKHIEVIIRQMLKKVKIENPGDTDLLPGGLIDIIEFDDENSRVLKKVEPCRGKEGIIRYNEGIPCYRFFPLCSFVPRNYQGADGSGNKRQGRPAYRFKRECHYWQADTCQTGMKRYRNIEVISNEDQLPEKIKMVRRI